MMGMAMFNRVPIRRPSCHPLEPGLLRKRAARSLLNPRPKCLPGMGEALVGKADIEQKKVSVTQDYDDDSEEIQVLRKRVADLQERLDRMEGQLAQMSDQMRDHAVSMMSAIQQQSTAEKVEQSLEGEASKKEQDELDLDGVMARFTEVMVKGYLEAVHRLRDRLMVTEWELTLKPLAMRQGVGAFESYCTENQLDNITFEELTALYEDPTNLDAIKDTQLRMRARSCINQAVIAEQQQVYQACSQQAQALASQYSQGDFISKILPEGGVLDALKSAVIPAMKAVMPGNS